MIDDREMDRMISPDSKVFIHCWSPKSCPLSQKMVRAFVGEVLSPLYTRQLMSPPNNMVIVHAISKQWESGLTLELSDSRTYTLVTALCHQQRRHQATLLGCQCGSSWMSVAPPPLRLFTRLPLDSQALQRCPPQPPHSPVKNLSQVFYT